MKEDIFKDIRNDIKKVIKENGGNDLHFDMLDLFLNAIEIAISKNKDYAGEDDQFKNFRLPEVIGLCPVEVGIQLRRCDKFSRECNLLFKENSVKDESIYDTLLDDINYTAILYVYLKRKEEKLKNNKNDKIYSV